jgi:hypothetical protein
MYAIADALNQLGAVIKLGSKWCVVAIQKVLYQFAFNRLQVDTGRPPFFMIGRVGCS